MRTIERILPHISIVLSGMLIVFFILDRFNPAMGYLDNSAERVVLLTLALTSTINAIQLVAHQRRG